MAELQLTRLLLTISAFLGIAIGGSVNPNDYFAVHLTPEQVHLSLGEQINEFVVTWVTLNQTAEPSTVRYGEKHTSEFTATGDVTEFTDEGPLKMKRWVHRVKLSNLKPDTEYIYHCGSTDSWSNLYRFKTMPDKPVSAEWTLKFLIFGDLGNGEAKTLSMLQDEIELQSPDVVFHVGDFAYNLEDDNGRVGDAWFREIEPIATQRPYQVCVGNHEKAYNFSHYLNRFTMYQQGIPEMNNWYWSYDIGNAHVIIFSTEFYYYSEYFDTLQIRRQWRWLEDDLKKANLPENRLKRPWIITMAHRPLYNQYYVNDKIRVGNSSAPGVEKLFYDYGVDLCYFGHDHLYERTWPVYNNRVMNGSFDEPYTNPRAPVHVTTGSAGCILAPPSINPNRPAYSALANADYSFTRMQIFNSTHLKIEQISQNQKGKAIDSFYIIKDKHGPYRQ